MTGLQLLEAASKGRLDDVKRFLDEQEDVNCVDERKRTPLHLAAAGGHMDTVLVLIQHGAQVNAADVSQYTPLITAAGMGHANVVQILIDSGALINVMYNYALISASRRGHTNVVNVLISNGAQVNERGVGYQTPLLVAAAKGHADIVQILIDNGSKLNVTDLMGRTPLAFAEKKGHVHVVQILKGNGALGVAIAEKRLLEATSEGRLKDVKHLLVNQVAVDCTDRWMNTPLHLAARSGHVDVVMLLIDFGAQVGAANVHDRSPLLNAAVEGHMEVMQVLIDNGAYLEKMVEIQLLSAARQGRLKDVKHLLVGQVIVDCEDEKKRTPLYLAAKLGHSDIVKVLIKRGAHVNVRSRGNKSPLMKAAANDHAKVVQMLIKNGAHVNATDTNQWTPLMHVSYSGGFKSDPWYHNRIRVVKLLLNSGAFVDALSNNKQTALMLAVQSGLDKVVKALIKHGACIDAANDKQQTALMLAVTDGGIRNVRALLFAGASLDVKDENEETALTYAVVGDHNEIALELLKSSSDALRHSMTLMKLGIQKKRHDAAEMRTAKAEEKAEVTLQDLVQLCSKMHEAQKLSERIYSRIVDVQQQIESMSEITKQEATPRFKQIRNKAYEFMMKHGDKNTVLRLVGSRAVMSTSRDLNRELDSLLLQFNIQSEENGVHDWQERWENDSVAMKSLLKESLKETDMLMNELQDPQVQKEALTLLMFEYDNNASQYSEEEMILVHKIFKDVSSMSKLEIDSVPTWFVPPHEIDFNSKTSFAHGSYGSVHRGSWNGTLVVVKSAFMTNEKSRAMFLNETKIWVKLQHPHIIKLFRACHVGNPFFVCEFASNGTLSDYLYQDNIRYKTWAKLHEAAMGLQYLHALKMVHNDLKCNNILVSADGTAKLTDFGLSFELESGQKEIPSPEEVGAINWKAPEVITGKTCGAFASDVYSFGMCIIEAVTGRTPWGMMPDVAVKYKIFKQKALPKQPSEMSDTQWDLVKRMCAWEPADRISMYEAVKMLAEFALQEREQEWTEYEARQRTLEAEH